MIWKNTQNRVGILLIIFSVTLLIATFIIIKHFISPQIIEKEIKNIQNTIELQSTEIKKQMNQVKSQQRVITEISAGFKSDQIDEFLPLLINQYGDLNVFGGGIWPLPGKRDPAREKFSTFYARNTSGILQINTVWNQNESAKYWEQAWYKDGMNAPKGECAWAHAYQDAASPQPRTNCAMPIIKDGKVWGVATIDVTLGFFNQLAISMGKAVGGSVLIVEADGKIVGNGSSVQNKPALSNVRDLNLPSYSKLSSLLAKDNKKETIGTYDGPNGSHTLLILPISGSPWFMVVDIPSSQLVSLSDDIINKLTIVQSVIGLLIFFIMMSILRNIFRNVTLLNKNIEALSSGGADLTQRLEKSKNQEFNNIVNNFNKFISFLNELMQQVNNSSMAISSASNQIVNGNHHLSSRTEEQSSSIVETAASMEELTSTVRHNAENAIQANKLAAEATQAA
ncbi:methyl-accepting chemotaxis protein, partial [Erwinia sp. V71]|uniref:methyl-accepting chemotaxis protein n=1 Tax=Erwinia sp. V71 TaxID=3369424 RepID=UPI003F621670